MKYLHCPKTYLSPCNYFDFRSNFEAFNDNLEAHKKCDMEVNYEVGPHKLLGWHIVVTLGSLASAMGASFSVLLNNSSDDDDEKERVRKTIIIVLLR